MADQVKGAIQPSSPRPIVLVPEVSFQEAFNREGLAVLRGGVDFSLCRRAQTLMANCLINLLERK
jgi:hypothetical protein